MKIENGRPLDLPASQPVAAADEGTAAYWEQAQKAAEKFESYFIAQMMKDMRRSTRELSGDDGIFKDKVNDDMLSMADGLVADTLSGQRAFGIADAILRQLLPVGGAAPAAVQTGEFNDSPSAVAMESEPPQTKNP